MPLNHASPQFAVGTAQHGVCTEMCAQRSDACAEIRSDACAVVGWGTAVHPEPKPKHMRVYQQCLECGHNSMCWLEIMAHGGGSLASVACFPCSPSATVNCT